MALEEKSRIDKSSHYLICPCKLVLDSSINITIDLNYNIRMEVKFDAWDIAHITDYLLNDIKESLRVEVETAIQAYFTLNSTGKKGGGFYSIPRLIFPEIDNLGSFLTGKPESTGENITKYLKEVVSKIDKRYAEFAGFLVVIFRHGLLHQHRPKTIIHKNKFVTSQIYIGSIYNPIELMRKNHLVFKGNLFLIDVNVLYIDILNSVDILISEFSNGKYIDTFNKSMKIQQSPLLKSELLKKHQHYLVEDDFKFLG